MARLIERLLLLLRFISAFGARGIIVVWKLYVGRPGKVVSVNLDGHRFFVRKRTGDVGVFRQVFVERESDLRTFPQSALVMKKYREIIRCGRKPLVVDCGAHTGLSTIFLNTLFPQATIVALEPANDNFDLLRRNVADCQTVVTLRAGVWDKSTYLRIINSPQDSHSYQTAECCQSDPGAIAAVSVPDLLEKFAESDPLLIKIDVEGSEQVLFRSNTGWVDKFPLLIIELHDWLLPQQKTSAPFLALIPKMGGDFVSRGENIFLFNWSAMAEERCQPERDEGLTS